MSSFKPTEKHFQHVLLYLFNQNKTASESHRILVEVYGSIVPALDVCMRWFRLFKSGDFEIKDKERPDQSKNFEDAEFQGLFDGDDRQTQQQMAESKLLKTENGSLKETECSEIRLPTPNECLLNMETESETNASQDVENKSDIYIEEIYIKEEVGVDDLTDREIKPDIRGLQELYSKTNNEQSNLLEIKPDPDANYHETKMKSEG